VDYEWGEGELTRLRKAYGAASPTEP